MTGASALNLLTPVGLTLDLVGAAYLSLRFSERPGEVIDRTVNWWPTVEGQEWADSAQPIHVKSLRSEVQNVVRARVGVTLLAVGFALQLASSLGTSNATQSLGPAATLLLCGVVALSAVWASRCYLRKESAQFFHAAMEQDISDRIIPRKNWLRSRGSSGWKRSGLTAFLRQLLAPSVDG